jgi:hypothetical protein
MLGHTIAEYILARLGVETSVTVRSFAPPDTQGSTLDLDLVAQDVDTGGSSGIGDIIGGQVPVAAATGTASVLAQLYTYGQAERASLLP